MQQFSLQLCRTVLGQESRDSVGILQTVKNCQKSGSSMKFLIFLSINDVFLILWYNIRKGQRRVDEEVTAGLA